MMALPPVGTLARVMHRVKQGAALSLKSMAVVWDALRPPPPGLVVLAYHRVGGGSGLEFDVDPAVFADQIQALAAEHRLVTLDEGLELVAEGRAPGAGGQPAVVITFDDGTADFVEHALPVLVSAGAPATYYIATRFVDEQQPFPDNGTPLSWAALAEAVSTGLVTIGSHTHSHAVMDKLTPAAADEELRRSLTLIEDHLGQTAHHFAYPKGVFGGEANEAIVARHCSSAALADCGVNRFGATDPLRLDRTPIQRTDGMRFFARKAAGGMALEGRVRANLNRRRYESATN